MSLGPKSRLFFIVLTSVVIAATIAVGAMPTLRERLTAFIYGDREAGQGNEKHGDESGAHTDEGHAGDDHGGHAKTDSLELSKQAQANIRLKVGKVELSTFERTITIPGMLRERPGRSTVEITAPLTGIVTQIYPIEGEAVRPGQKLFELRLTHEELVQAQGDFLRVAEELDVIEREIKRLEKIAVDGGIPGRQVLERQYEQQNKQAVLRAQKQALLLHGLSDVQVQEILTKRTLLRDLTVRVPEESGENSADKPAATTTYEIKSLKIARGQSVNAGESLAVLTDHAELFIEGNAFDKDVASINRAIEIGATIQATIESEDTKPEVISGLKILYVSGDIDPESRTFHFYAKLPNPLLRDTTSEDGHRFISWRYKPGQRVQLTVPVEKWKDRIVLPVDAVAQDGVETYVFLPNGDHFDRHPVHVEYRDRLSVVIANDGSVFPGDAVVTVGAQQMQLALKNKSGGAIDPHAGHNH
ncbi:MAG: secretion protein HlyD [Pirellula sp.]|nr:secretion protein HlyD [Pirellula sp.]